MVEITRMQSIILVLIVTLLQLQIKHNREIYGELESRLLGHI